MYDDVLLRLLVYVHLGNAESVRENAMKVHELGGERGWDGE